MKLYLARYTPTPTRARGEHTFTAAGDTRPQVLRTMRALLAEHASRKGLKRNWFDPEAIEVLELETGCGYRDTSVLVQNGRHEQADPVSEQPR